MSWERIQADILEDLADAQYRASASARSETRPRAHALAVEYDAADAFLSATVEEQEAFRIKYASLARIDQRRMASARVRRPRSTKYADQLNEARKRANLKRQRTTRIIEDFNAGMLLSALAQKYDLTISGISKAISRRLGARVALKRGLRGVCTHRSPRITKKKKTHLETVFKLRLVNGLSIARIARRLDLTETTVSRWLRELPRIGVK